MSIEVVGLIGLSGSGKSTVARYLSNKYGYVLLSFSQPIKEMLSVLRLTISELYDNKLKDHPCDVLEGKTPRYAMQTLGVEWGRNLISKDIWCNILKHEMDRYVIGGSNKFVIDDVRFFNEVLFLRSINFKSDYCYRVNIIRILRMKEMNTNVHISESENTMIHEDYVIKNNMTILELHEQVEKLLIDIKKTSNFIEHGK